FILVHSLLEFPFAYGCFLFPLGLLLGIASSDRTTRYQLRLPSIVLLIFIVAGVWLLNLAISDNEIIKADYQEQRMAAANVIGFESDIHIAQVVFLNQFRELQRFKGTDPSLEYDDEQLRWMEKVVRQYPHLPVLYRYVLTLIIN